MTLMSLAASSVWYRVSYDMLYASINFFADAAVSIGLAKGLDSQQSILNEMDEPVTTQWLRVWETIRFLDL